jgi:hypothetical protein
MLRQTVGELSATSYSRKSIHPMAPKKVSGRSCTNEIDDAILIPNPKTLKLSSKLPLPSIHGNVVHNNWAMHPAKIHPAIMLGANMYRLYE